VNLLLLLAVPLAGCVALWAAPERLARAIGVAVTGMVLLLTFALVASYNVAAAGVQYGIDVRWIPVVDVRFHLGVDGISLPLVVLTALLMFLCAIYTMHTLPDPGRPRAFLALLLVLEVGMLGTFLALDLLLFFIFFEVVLLPMYFLIGIWGGGNARYASIKFILYTLLGSAVMLLGLLGIYAATGTLDMVALAANRGAGIARGVQILCFLALLLGFGVKAPMWPLHTWLPDAHTEAPTVGSVLLAGVLLKMGTYGLVRIGLPILPAGARALAPALGVLAVIGICYGALCCLAQRDLKRLVAYSSVGHMGFVLLGIATLTPVGINAALFANLAHGLITGLLFFLAGAIKERYGTADLEAIGGGLLTKAPALGGLLTFAAIASLGLPGLAGFWGEMLAMLGAYRPAAGLNRPLFAVLMVLAGIGTLLAAAYLLGLLRRLTLGVVAPRWRGVRYADLGALELATAAPLLVLTLAVGLYPRLILGITDGAVRGVFGG
jgi:NADH-quinone oxidoreductase subunit M